MDFLFGGPRVRMANRRLLPYIVIIMFDVCLVYVWRKIGGTNGFVNFDIYIFFVVAIVVLVKRFRPTPIAINSPLCVAGRYLSADFGK